jgi:hypothetical protein
MIADAVKVRKPLLCHDFQAYLQRTHMQAVSGQYIENKKQEKVAQSQNLCDFIAISLRLHCDFIAVLQQDINGFVEYLSTIEKGLYRR